MSEAGLCFVTGHVCSVGEELTLAWRMDGSEPPFQVHCIVRHVSNGQIGVEYANLTLSERLRLTEAFLRRGEQCNAPERAVRCRPFATQELVLLQRSKHGMSQSRD